MEDLMAAWPDACLPARTAPIAVIGCGNPNRSDDGVGIEVIRRLAPHAGTRVKLLDAGTDGMAVMFAARGCTTLIIVDACATGSEPGTVFEVPAERVAAPYRASYTLHDFRWDHAVDAGRKLYGAGFPADIIVLLIEASSLAFGRELSAAVTGAAVRAVARVEQLLVQRGAFS
jgi:hydrogenase maturation protease